MSFLNNISIIHDTRKDRFWNSDQGHTNLPQRASWLPSLYVSPFPNLLSCTHNSSSFPTKIPPIKLLSEIWNIVNLWIAIRKYDCKYCQLWSHLLRNTKGPTYSLQEHSLPVSATGQYCNLHLIKQSVFKIKKKERKKGRT